jgi:integrase
VTDQHLVPGPDHSPSVSVFTGADVCELARLTLLPGSVRPVFDQDVWVLDGLADAHRMMGAVEKRWDFTIIANPSWRRMAKELMLALLAPTHEAVARLPHAHRERLSPRTCRKHLNSLIKWLSWLDQHRVRSLAEVTQLHCDQFLQHAFVKHDPNGNPTETANMPGSVAARVWVLQLVAIYGELFSTDRYQPGFTPWNGTPANTVAGHQRAGENRTSPVPLPVLQPLLAACLYLVDTIGPHLVELRGEFRRAPEWGSAPPGLLTDIGIARLTAFLAGEIEAGHALQRLPQAAIDRRLADGWSPADPVLPVNLSPLGHQLGYGRVLLRHVEQIRPHLEHTVRVLGVEHAWGRNAAPVLGADGGKARAWTLPVSYHEIRGLITAVRTACLILTAAASGMRTSELLELRVGCRRSPRTVPGGGQRFRLASKVIKGRQFGGEDDEWVVVAEVDQAIALAERLHGGDTGEPVFGAMVFHTSYPRLRNWINGPTGQRLGLTPISASPLNLRMLRRTLAQELAQRPGGLLAAKIHLKHVSTATTEGYANRPGGSQALFHAEVQELEEEHHFRLTIDAFRQFQAGQLPAGLGARDLIATFTHIDNALRDSAPAEPTVLDTDRRIENLLRAQAASLHVGPANYCWFRDPSKALCLRLAGTTEATRPLIGLCDSARCPQATHHACHRPIWAEQAATFQAFLGNPRVPTGEKTRLRREHDRVQRVLDSIDEATSTAGSTPVCPPVPTGEPDICRS